jgi:hypothetical protein
MHPSRLSSPRSGRNATGQDALLLKYPLTGGTPAEFWYDGFAGGDALNDLVVDAGGNVFATGSSANDFETIPTFSGGISRVSSLPCGDPQSAAGIQWVYP